MPSVAPRRQVRPDDSDDDATEDTLARQNGSMATSDEELPDGSSDTSVNNRSQKKRRPLHNGLNAQDDEYHPGAIVRVMVDDFVTYEHAEFLPGPNLNMVIGPNGTGKSSLVCAICLGLGFHPKHLGRASHVGEFVKHGKETATIEVELQKRPDDRINPVIRVQIRKEDNGRRWWLNGKESTHKAVQNLTRDLRIQIDNLCQFLPQDKVAEFAGLTPVQLLHETLRAAAPEEMIAWQDKLQELHRDHKKVKEQVDNTAELLKRDEGRQQGMQADVDRLRERENIQRRVSDLKKAQVVAEYNSARQKHTEFKARRKTAERRFKDLQRASEPALKAVNHKRDYEHQVNRVVEHRKKMLKDSERTGDQLLRDSEKRSDEMKNLENKIEAESESFKARRIEVSKIRKAITDLEAKKLNRPPPFEPSEWNLKIREKENLLRDNEAERREIGSRLEQLKRRGNEIHNERRSIETNLKELESQQGQQLALLKKMSPDAWKAWGWLRDNQDRFDKEVFGPPMLSCSVKDPRYTDLMESLLQFDDFLCFSAQTVKDHKTLTNIFVRELDVSVTIRTAQHDLSEFRPPAPLEYIRQNGLDGYALDLLEGPAPVLSMLCGDKKLHACGVGLQKSRIEQTETLLKDEKINTWVSGGTSYRVTRRKEYGPGATSTLSKNIRPGRFWTNQAFDNDEKLELERRLEELATEFDELKKQNTEKKQRLQTLNESDGQHVDEVNELKSQKSELQKAATIYEALPAKIEAEQRKLDEASRHMSESRNRANEIQAEQDKAACLRAEAALQHQLHLERIQEALQSLLDSQIRLIEASSDVKGLEAQNLDVKNRLEEEKALIEKIAAESEEIKAKATAKREELSGIVEEMGNDGLAYLNEVVASRSVEETSHEIGAEEAKLELIHGVDPSILRQFEKRAHDIQDLTRRKADLQERLDSVAAEIEDLRSRWEPRVDQLVGKINEAFSYNFEQISCAGEVGVYKNEDFEQWAIEIKVKFRENETLQQLNQHRQSGGERAVSTIFYLMALQSMAQAPFRVVDEINQGMDPRNERMVHERMVEIACREHTSQYFLITPKLLTGLRYDDRMRVLCIASGDHMPREGRKLDFGRLVGIGRTVKAAA